MQTPLGKAGLTWQLGGEEFRGEMDRRTDVAGSLCCPPETITTLSVGHTPI